MYLPGVGGPVDGDPPGGVDADVSLLTALSTGGRTGVVGPGGSPYPGGGEGG